MTQFLTWTVSLISTAFLGLTVSHGQTKEKNDKLKDLYKQATINPDSLKFQKPFLDAFPGNSKDFYAVFSNNGELYSESQNYIDLLFRLTTVSDTIFYKKIIDILIGEKWEADAVNYFQDHLRKKVFANPRLTFYLLKKKSNKDIQGFFFFFFNSIHPVYKTIPEQLTAMKSYDSRVYKLMQKGLDEALIYSGH